LTFKFKKNIPQWSEQLQEYFASLVAKILAPFPKQEDPCCVRQEYFLRKSEYPRINTILVIVKNEFISSNYTLSNKNTVDVLLTKYFKLYKQNRQHVA
jgi:hypothetical protein